MRIAFLFLLAGCATWAPGEYRPLGDSGVVCAHRKVAPPEQAPGGVMVSCHTAADPFTSRAFIVGERGQELTGEGLSLFGAK